MIPQQIPVKNHYGNNSATIFDFDFYIENEEQLLITHTDLDGKETILELGVDYKINSNSIGYSEGGNITFPLDGSRYDVLAWDTSTDKKELLSIALNIPIEQPAEYGLSDHLSMKNIEYSFDYLTRICQIIMHTLERTMKVSEGSGEMNLKLPLPESNQTFKWNEDATALENYDIIGENNAFKTQLISDIEDAQEEMTTTIATNKAELESELAEYKDVTDTNIDNFKAAVNTTLADTRAEFDDKINTFTDNTTLEIIDFKAKVEQDIIDAKSDLQTQMNTYQMETNADIEDFKLSVESTISQVEEAAEKINELEESVEVVLEKTEEVERKATQVEALATEVSQKADVVVQTAENLADKGLTNLNAVGQAKLDAKLESSIYNEYVSNTAATLSGLENNKATKTALNTLSGTVAANKTEAQTNLDNAKNELNANIDKKANLIWYANRDFEYKHPKFIHADKASITIKGGTAIGLYDGSYFYTAVDVSYPIASILDSGSVGNGKDYYFYIDTNKNIKATLNESIPAGCTLIGGAHTLCVGVTSQNAPALLGDSFWSSHPAIGYNAGHLIPNTAWTPAFKSGAKTGNKGQAFIEYYGFTPFWTDIYLQSGTGRATASSYAGTITNSRQCILHEQDMRMVGKKLPQDWQFSIFSEGSNQKTSIAGGAIPSGKLTGGYTDTAGKRMISGFFIECCCGYLWQWGDEIGPTGGSGWVAYADTNRGGSYGMPHVVRFGGGCDDSTSCGSWARICSRTRTTAGASVGARGVSLHIERGHN